VWAGGGRQQVTLHPMLARVVGRLKRWRPGADLLRTSGVMLGLSRIVALHHRSSTSYQIH
jgi:hypothetical protein